MNEIHLKEKQFIVEEDGHGKRIDLYLAELMEGLTRSQLQRLIAEKKVLVNEGKVKANLKLKAGDMITYQSPAVPETTPLLPENIALEIIYEDDGLIVLNKPRGMLVYPAGAQKTGTLVNGLLYHCPGLSEIGEKHRPGIVHRLDKETTGLMVVAKKDKIHTDLVRQFKEGLVQKEYLALVHGLVSEPGGIIDAPIGRDLKNRQRMAVIFKNSKEALTKYQVLERFLDYTLLRCQLETGRMHQIRVHLAYLQHPVVGDAKYLTPAFPKDQGKELGLEGQALHAFSLSLIHPDSQERLNFTVNPPQDFLAALHFLGSGFSETFEPEF